MIIAISCLKKKKNNLNLFKFNYLIILNIIFKKILFFIKCKYKKIKLILKNLKDSKPQLTNQF